MSLLLDALKRAEQEKLARQSSGVAPHPAPTSPAAPRAVPNAANSAAGALELQPLPHAADAAASRAAPPGRPEAGVQAAQNVFHAKSGASRPAAEEPRGRSVLWVALGAIAILAIAAGAYIWYSVKSLTPQYTNAPRPRPAPTPPASSSSPLPPTTAMGSIVPAPGAATANVEVSAAPAAPLPASAAPAPLPETPAERLSREAPAPAAPPPLRMDRAAEGPRRVPAEVSSGYEALRQGDLASARRSYEAALASDPNSIDAHLGLATIAARVSNRTVAAEHYRRVLGADPSNATALAGIAALSDFTRPDTLEANLRADIARVPESAALHFTLGNLHASQSRWSEAQTAYFEAHRLEPASADIAYNLAVSLDQLGQRRVAADFYRRALESARGRAVQFDPAAVTRRLEELR